MLLAAAETLSYNAPKWSWERRRGGGRCRRGGRRRRRWRPPRADGGGDGARGAAGKVRGAVFSVPAGARPGAPCDQEARVEVRRLWTPPVAALRGALRLPAVQLRPVLRARLLHAVGALQCGLHHCGQPVTRWPGLCRLVGVMKTEFSSVF